MRKLFLLFVLFVMFAMAAPVYANDPDGLWYQPDPQGGYAAMSRASNGSILFTILDCHGLKLMDWVPLFGPFDGISGNLSLALSTENNSNLPQVLEVTLTITSPTTATLAINNCAPWPGGQAVCPSPGTVLTFVRVL
jgi:hypothetical protein